MTGNDKIIKSINECSDVVKLRNWIVNAERGEASDVADAARRRLIEVEAAEFVDDSSDPLVLEFWKSITALELSLTEERRRTTRLNRTRQKIARVGVQKTLSDLALQSKPSEDYFLLRDRGMLDLSAEAVVLRFSDRFSEDVIESARARLESDPEMK